DYPTGELPQVSSDAISEFLAAANTVLSDHGEIMAKSLSNSSGAGKRRLDFSSSPKQAEYERIFEAMAYVDNADLHYDDWVYIGHAIKGALGSNVPALDLFHSFSKKSSKYDSAKTDRLWQSIGEVKKIGAGTIFHHAAAGGYSVGEADEATKGAQKNFTLDEISVGEVYAEKHRDGIRYDHTNQKWHRWNNFCWRPDDTAMTLWDASGFTKILFDGCEKPGKPTMKFVKAALERASVEPDIGVTAEVWDRHDFLLGAPHGTVDLNTGGTVKSNPDDLISKSTGVDPHGDRPRWELFINEITQGDADLALYLQKVSGYCLTGSTREQALFFLYGPGGNGKSVFVEAIAEAMGDYAVATLAETFAAGGFDRHPTELARMAGARLVYASETEDGRKWNAARIKQLTGGDKIAARFMRQDFFEFTPRFKIIILGNHKPSLTNVTEGERRRLHIIPLEFVPDEPDHHLADTLRGEAGGILKWMIEGACLWNEQGLEKPKIVAEATNEYFAEQDLFRQWLDDDCRYEPGNTHLSEAAGKLFKSWRNYAKDAGEDTETRKSFGDRLRRANLRPDMQRLGGKSQRVWVGIELHPLQDSIWDQSG
ncbi:MAG: hypothetical protein HOC72_05625, partial [Rhodospirillaceae bacterium]|nr:hypothetical protein [Rhodospirillaceae bacterium]